MTYLKQLLNRQSIRLDNHDYSRKGYYFITICCQDKIHRFGKIQNGQMLLNELGKIAREEWLKTSSIRPNISLGEFIIMPDHMHMISHINEQIKTTEKKDWIYSNPQSPSQTIGAIIRGFKGSTTKRINEFLNSSTGELQF